jgi:N-acetyl-anhydromuramyl-L-alanine amidase AmpD
MSPDALFVYRIWLPMRCFTVTVICFLLMTYVSVAPAQEQRMLIAAFESAGNEFNVPVEVLKGIAFAETRWQHLQWAEGDTASCMGMPHAYGVMSLRDDDIFGHTLRTAAQLIGRDVNTVKRDVVQNIRAAAALLKQYHDRLPLPEGTGPNDIESWENAIAAYSGISQPELAHQHALDIFNRVTKGYHDYGIEMQAHPLNLVAVRQRVSALWQQAQQREATKLDKTANQPDYLDAKWAPAYPGHWYTEGYARDFVVIHDMEGFYLAVISYFQQSTTNASAHYCINGLQDNASDSPAGEITQMVEEKYWAWHVICWNRYMLGIEHEGFVSNPAWYTPEMYLASAKLTKYLCDKYNIPKDRNHIIGHQEWQNPNWVNWVKTSYNPLLPAGVPDLNPTCNTHTDPGQYWDWDFYMQLVKQDSTPPRVVSQPPSTRLNLYDTFSMTFDQRMEPGSIQRGLSISPSVPGTLSWSTDNRTVTFTPSAYWNVNTTYTVTLDTSAHNYLSVKLDVDGDGIGGDPYSFTFQTVERDTNAPQLTATYPAENQSLISTTVEMVIDFNEPLDSNTIGQAFELRDDAGNSVPISNFSYTYGFGFAKVKFRPAFELEPVKTYQLIINQQAKDFGGNSIATPRTVTFTTEPTVAINGTVIDALDDIGGWWQPSQAGQTANVQASFTIVTDAKKGGSGSGKLTYSFTQSSGGYIREHTLSQLSIEGAQYMGAWIFGDNGKSQLEYWFYKDESPQYVVVSDGPINWTGWKLKSLQTSLVSGTNRRFASFGIKQIAGSQTSGVIYFDQVTIGNSVTSVEGPSGTGAPTSFALFQNYPNPFNPTTAIRYQLAANSFVTLKVFDILGREVATLVNEVRPAGTYVVTWNASALASGVYVYRMESRGTGKGEAGYFVTSRKMVLLR